MRSGMTAGVRGRCGAGFGSGPGSEAGRCQKQVGARSCLSEGARRGQMWLARSSATTVVAISRAFSRWSLGRLMAPTLACPPPPKRAQMSAMLSRGVRGFCSQGLVPTDIFVLLLERVMTTA